MNPVTSLPVVPANCDTATATVVVLNPIDAVDDNTYPTQTPSTTVATTVGNVTTNDTLNGVPVTAANTDVTPITTGPLSISATGVLTLAPNTPSGTYTIVYQLCEVNPVTSLPVVPANCDSAIATVVVLNPIIANDDIGIPILSATGGQSFANVLVNDILNGIPATLSNVILTQISTTNPGVTLNPANGSVNVASGTLGGNYTIVYQICEIGAVPANCDTATVTIFVQQPSMTITKDGLYVDNNGNGIANVGDTVVYTFTVTNTGNVPLTNITVTDINATVSGSLATLAVGASNSTAFTAVHILTQADIDAGQVDNLATVTGNPPLGPPVTNISVDPTPCSTCTPLNPSCTLCTIVPIIPSPSMTITKEGTYVDNNGDGITNVGDLVFYNFVVTNTGNVTLFNITVTDINATVTGGPLASLAVGASNASTFTAVHVITQADIDAGQVDNLATVTGNPPIGSPITATSTDPTPCVSCTPLNPNCTSCTIVPLNNSPSISLIKTAEFDDNNGDGIAQVGETITYNFTVTNTGNVTLTNITISDPLPGVIVTGGPISLAPGQSDSTTFVGTYTLTLQDLINESVTNQAVVSGIDADATTVRDLSDNTNILGNNPTVIQINGCEIEVYNAISPNGSPGINDTFVIRGIEYYPNNTVEIYNRWGVLVFESKGYDNTTRVFRGVSEGRSTVSQASGLPDGTYFYVLRYTKVSGENLEKAGYLYIKN